MHSARVQQRRQPQRGERPGAGGRSQLGGSRTEPRRSGPREGGEPDPGAQYLRHALGHHPQTTHTCASLQRAERRKAHVVEPARQLRRLLAHRHVHVVQQKERCPPSAPQHRLHRSISTSCARARTSGKARPCSAARSPPHAAKRWAATREAVHCSSCSSATTAGRAADTARLRRW